MGSEMSVDNMCGYGGRHKDGTGTREYTPEEREYVSKVFRKLDKNGDNKLEARELEEKMVEAYMFHVKDQVRLWMAQHKIASDPDKSYITEEEFLEFNKRFVVDHRSPGSTDRPSLLSTQMMRVSADDIVLSARASPTAPEEGAAAEGPPRSSE